MRTSREDQRLRARIAELLRQGLAGVVIRERLGCGGDIVTAVKKQLAAEAKRGAR